MMSELELREQLAKLLDNEISLDAFEDWFVQHSWNMHKDSYLDAQRLAYAVELRLSEYNNEHLPESELRKEISELVNSPIRIIPVNSPLITTGVSAQNFTHQPWVFQSVDTLPLKAS